MAIRRLFLRAFGFRLAGPTACACRALGDPRADTSELFHMNDTDALLLSMRDDLMRELVVGVAHPPLLFALALADGADLLALLKFFPARVELTALGALLTPVAKETMALPDVMDHGGHLDTQVYPHDGLTRRGFRFWQCACYLSYPLAALALDTQQPRRTVQRHRSTPYADLLNLAALTNGQNKSIALSSPVHAPVLIIPLADGLAQER